MTIKLLREFDSSIYPPMSTKVYLNGTLVSEVYEILGANAEEGWVNFWDTRDCRSHVEYGEVLIVEDYVSDSYSTKILSKLGVESP